MEESRYPLYSSYLSAAALAVVACVLRTLALFLSFDSDPGYFRSGALLPILYYALAAVSILWFFSFPLRVRKGTPVPEFPAPEAPLLCGRAVCAAAFAATAVLLILTAKSQAAPTIVPFLSGLFLLAGCAYFLLPLFGKTDGAAPLLCGYAVIFGAVLLLCTTYFDRFTPMNAPHKVGGHLALLSLMLAALMELRAKIGRRAPRIGAVLHMTAFFLCFTVGLSGLIAFAGGVYDDLTYLLADLLLFAFSLYLAAKNAGVFFPAPAARAAGPTAQTAEPTEEPTAEPAPKDPE